MSKPQLMNTKERAVAGFIITIVDLDTGREEVEHVGGYHFEVGSAREIPPIPGGKLLRQRSARVKHALGVEDSLRCYCAQLEARADGDWRVRSISTPATIYADLKGRDPGGHNGRTPSPERIMLQKAGFIHLAERLETGS